MKRKSLLAWKYSGGALIIAMTLATGQVFAATSGKMAVKADKHQTRAIAGVPTNVANTATAYDSTNEILYAGANAGGAAAEAVVGASLSASGGTANVENINPLAPANTSINGAAAAPSPIANLEINQVALSGSFPVVTIPVLNATNAASLGTVVVISDPVAGATVQTNAAAALVDAGGVAIAATKDAAVAALAASSDTIFAAVPPDNQVFGIANSGIMRFDIPAANGALTGRKTDGSAGVNNAYGISLASIKTNAASFAPVETAVPVIVSVNGADGGPVTIAAPVDMYWDNQLSRLFVGLSQVVGTNVDAAAVESVLVGQIKAGSVGPKALFLQPVVPFSATSIAAPLLQDGSNNAGKNSIIGFENADATAVQTSALKVRTMHTSTGLSYLVVNGGSTAGANPAATFGASVFAIPITANGLVANNDDAVTQLNALAKATVANSSKAIVGVASTRIGVADGVITDLRVVGDTVYASVKGTRGALNKEAGVFASTAIFNAAGLINRWTPWERAGAPIEPVTGFGVGPADANVAWLSQTDNKTIKSTAWGTSADVVGAAGVSRNLSNTLSGAGSYFGTTGIERVFNFSTETPGFVAGNPFAMDVAVGGNTVVLAQTVNGAAFASATPTVNFLPTVFANGTLMRNGTTNPDLAAIAPLTCAEVSRNGVNATNGFVYVGGANGLARLQQPGVNVGWNGNTGLNAFNNAGLSGAQTIGTDSTFVKVPQWNNQFVQSIASDGTNLWVLSLNQISRCGLDAIPVAANTITFNSALFGNAAFGFDMVVLNNATPLALFATTAGLFTTTDGTVATTAQVEGDDDTQNTLFANNMIPVQLAYVSPTTGLNGDLGNLFVLVADPLQVATSRLYRFAVNKAGGAPYLTLSPFKVNVNVAGVLTPTTSNYIDLGIFCRYFAMDGGLILAARSDVEAANQDYLQVFNIANSTATAGQLFASAGTNLSTALDLSGVNVFTNVPVKDTATGGWVVPGDWGVRVQE